jgi:citrate lyase subunit beta/citryl-CoA lyase
MDRAAQAMPRVLTAVHRSYLFVPANRPDRYAKACATRADAVIVDLEDAVAPDAKAGARSALAEWLPKAPRPVLVRINAADTEWFAADLALCAGPNVGGILLPKCERADDLQRIAAACAGVPLHPLVETAQGLWNAIAIAQSPAVRSMLFGSLDFQADLGIGDDDLLHARSQLVLVSRVAGIAAPIDGVTQAIDDPEAIRRDAARSRELGFGGKACIHPNQVDIVNECFAPTAAEVRWAEVVVAAFATSAGDAVRVEGRMVDRPVLLKAQGILAERSPRTRD